MLKRAYNISLVATSIIVFIAWTSTSRIPYETFENNMVIRNLVLILINSLVAYGSFNALARIIVYISNKCKLIKRLAFRSSYIQGVWVGYSLGDTDDEPRYDILTIEQNMDSMIVQVKAYGSDLKLRRHVTPECSWLDSQKQILMCVSTSRFVSAEGKDGRNYVEYYFENNGGSTIPDRMDGILVHLKERSSRQIYLKKISDLPHKKGRKELLKEADDFYKDNEGIANDNEKR